MQAIGHVLKRCENLDNVFNDDVYPVLINGIKRGYFIKKHAVMLCLMNGLLTFKYIY